MSQSQIEFTVDVRPVKAGMDQANASIDSYEKKAVVAGQRVQDSLTKTSDVTVRLNEKNRQSFESLTTAMMRQTDQFTAHQNAFQRLLGDAERLGRGIGRVGIASAHAVEGVFALGGAFAGARALMKETTKEVGLLEVAAGKLRNVGRAVETAWGMRTRFNNWFDSLRERWRVITFLLLIAPMGLLPLVPKIIGLSPLVGGIVSLCGPLWIVLVFWIRWPAI
jgi:hypothetical protein